MRYRAVFTIIFFVAPSIISDDKNATRSWFGAKTGPPDPPSNVDEYLHKCDLALKRFERSVNADSSPVNTNLTKSIIALLKDFTELLDTDGADAGPRGLSSHQIGVLSRVLKLELFTRAMSHRFVSPVNEHKREGPFHDKVKHFAIRWFDPTTAESADSELDDDIKRVTSTVRAKLTAESFRELVDRLGNLLGKWLGYKEKADIGRSPIVSTRLETFKPRVHFSFDDLRRRNVGDENATAVTEWLNNFLVRRFLLHERMLALNKVRDVSENGRGLDSQAVTQFEDHARACFIFTLAKKQEKFKCAYVNVLDEYAEKFEARNWTDRIMETFRPKIVEAVKNLNDRVMLQDENFDGLFRMLLSRELIKWGGQYHIPTHDQHKYFQEILRKTILDNTMF